MYIKFWIIYTIYKIYRNSDVIIICALFMRTLMQNTIVFCTKEINEQLVI